MKSILYFAGIGLIAALSARAAEKPATATTAATEAPAGPIKVTFKALPSDKGDWGLDWKADFKKQLTKNTAENDPRSLFLGFTSTGLVVLDREENTSDSIMAALKLEGGAWVPIKPAPQPKRSIEDPGEIPVEIIKGGAPWYIFPSLNVVTETTQSFAKFNLGVGASVAVTTSVLNPFLDLIPSLLRYGPTAATNNPRHIDVSIGYKYIDQNFVSKLFPKQENISRGDLNLEWETGIFASQRLVLHYNGYYLFSGATKDYVDFFAVRLDLFKLPVTIDGHSTFSIKYTTGKLPPLYKPGTSLGGGISVDF